MQQNADLSICCHWLSDHEKQVHGSSLSYNNAARIIKSENEYKYIPSVTSALVIGGILGLVQAFILILGAKPLLNFMGVKAVSRHY